MVLRYIGKFPQVPSKHQGRRHWIYVFYIALQLFTGMFSAVLLFSSITEQSVASSFLTDTAIEVQSLWSIRFARMYSLPTQNGRQNKYE